MCKSLRFRSIAINCIVAFKEQDLYPNMLWVGGILEVEQWKSQQQKMQCENSQCCWHKAFTKWINYKDKASSKE